MTMENNKYTPNEIALSNIRFSIPLYQRLFEWEEVQIVQLLNDLYSSFYKEAEAPYYIGMLTAYKNNGKYDLVDGQQRFTVVMLMAIAFGWSEVLNIEVGSEDLRLTFSARSKDTEYLKAKIKDKAAKPKYINLKMEKGLEYIEAFLKKKEEDIATRFIRQEFVKFIYRKMTFFISDLPSSYQTNDLNKYFEAMNATGRGLENHEILKVYLLKQLSNDKKELYARIWNAVSEMDRPLIRKKIDEVKFDERQNNALKDFRKIDSAVRHCNFFITENTDQKSDNEENVPSIRAIPERKEAPKVIYHSTGERAILNFPEFLLQVLWLQKIQSERVSSTDFFNVHKLQETFKKHLIMNENKVEDFFNNMLKYRILFDYFIIQISSNESTTSYTLNFKSNDKDSDNKLIQYQSMLYVSTAYYLWITEILNFLEDAPENVNFNSLLTKIIDNDNERHKVDNISLNYNKINRYWFWRLDYYLWLDKNEHFGLDAFEVAKKYVFSSNRSIEHIAPQNPKSNSNVKFDDDLLHCFGNLAMISSGQNSSLQNESFEMKKAHVRSYIKKSKNGSIESLKLLKAFENENETWSEDQTINHHIKMIDILIDSFPDSAEYKNIREKLFDQKYDK